MKKILSLVLALALVCGLAVTAMAASAGLSADKDIIGVGDTVTVTITLDEAVPVESDTTSVEFKLQYDTEKLTYVSGTVSDAYKSLVGLKNSTTKKQVQISGTYYDMITGEFNPQALPAGTVAVITFSANETTTVEELALNLTFRTANSVGEFTNSSNSTVSVTVCPDHNVVTTTEGDCATGVTITSKCEACGYEVVETTQAGHELEDLVHMEAVEPGCHYTGNVEHWYCTICGTVWTDEALTQISNHLSVVLPALGGEVVHVEAKTPSCYEEGNIEYWYCEDCEQVWQDEALTQLTNRLNVVLPAACQNIVHIEAVEPGCHYTGNVEHWYCTDCGTVWTDEALTQISNHMNVIIPALGGDVVHVEAKTPSCYEEGNIEYWYCEQCEQVWQDEALTQLTNFKNVILPAACQNVVHVEAVAPTCTTEGNIEYWYCEDCGTVWQDENLMQITNRFNVILPAACQHVVHVEAVEPGCHFEGNIEYWYCQDCLTVWQDEALMQITNFKNVILPELGGDVVHVEAKAPTCTTEGNIEHWYCEECEQVWQDEAQTQLTNHKNVIIAATGHVDEDKDGICDVCGGNAKTGDFTIIAAAAAAVISMTSIVALPIAKKKFF